VTSLPAFRRLLLQSGGANIARADRALEAADFVVARRRKRVGSLVLSAAVRDPGLDCLATARADRLEPESLDARAAKRTL
jgi:hypothetical protein